MASRPSLTLQDLWDQYDFKPNEKQREAIQHIEGPLFLTAGPGSGKTRVLLWRTLNLIVFHKIKPEELFLSTFTEKAAHQLKEGLRSLLGLVTNITGQPYDISKMAIGTVHSICQDIINDRRFTSDGSRNNTPIIMDSLSQYFKVYQRRYWERMLEYVGCDDFDDTQSEINQYFNGRNYSSRHWAAQNCIKLFNRFSEECIEPSEVDPGNDTMLDILLEMYDYYRDSLKESDHLETVDFSLLQRKALDKIIAFKDAGHVFKYIIIDEYQDTNSIQERIFFELAKGQKNVCVVGDDDQALYRFRGATVENLVEFESRCEQHLNIRPRRIDLDINYRSKRQIVDFYVNFIEQTDWSKENELGHYRVADKNIKANNQESTPAIICTRKSRPEQVYTEIASFVKELKLSGKIEDYNQVAFLFPYLQGSTRVRGFKNALEEEGIPVYAPRAGRFLEIEEAMAIYGLFFQIFGRPSHQGRVSRGQQEFRDWTLSCMSFADELMGQDKQLTQFVEDRRAELDQLMQDYNTLIQVINKQKWNLDAPFKESMVRSLASANGLSEKARRSLTSQSFIKAIKRKEKEGQPYSLKYILNRTTSLDWSILDLFYQLNAFQYFRMMYRLAEDGTDEGPICNLGLITQYLSRFTEEYGSLISARFLEDKKFIHVFFGSYTYALFRLGESEYENTDDPFPKGRVPFLTIHQSKGLEFPVVVLGSLYKTERQADQVEIITRTLLNKEGEPLDKIGHFDNMRMFYVALSRGENLVMLPHFGGQGQRTSPVFKTMLSQRNLTYLEDFDISILPEAKLKEEDLGRSYSYTGDYLSYKQCPRSYMIFRKYGFVPSRSLTMFFGSLVHQTIEDLHHLLIQERSQQKTTAV